MPCQGDATVPLKRLSEFKLDYAPECWRAVRTDIGLRYWGPEVSFIDQQGRGRFGPLAKRSYCIFRVMICHEPAGLLPGLTAESGTRRHDSSRHGRSPWRSPYRELCPRIRPCVRLQQNVRQAPNVVFAHLTWRYPYLSHDDRAHQTLNGHFFGKVGCLIKRLFCHGPVGIFTETFCLFSHL